MTRPVVHLDGAAAGYARRPLWSGLDLDIAAGEFVTVLGGNGTGKTTLIRMLLGRHKVRAGRIAVFGAAPRRGNPDIGYIAQQRTFDSDVPIRGIDLVRYGLDGHRWRFGRLSHDQRRRIRAVLTDVAALEYADRPLGGLSGGEQQRLRVAQALISDPRLLLADEPLLSLDVASQRQISFLIHQQCRKRNTAVVFVTHDINPVLAYTDRILYLADNRWAVGTPDEVLTSETLTGLYRAPIEVHRVRNSVLIVGGPDAAHHPAEAGLQLERR